MNKLILSETITLFKTGGLKDLDGRMERACLCDLDKLRDRINIEINALPLNKKNMIKEVIINYLKDLVEVQNGNKNYWSYRP